MPDTEPTAEAAMREARAALDAPVAPEAPPIISRETGVLVDFVEGDGTSREASLVYRVPGIEDYATMATFRAGPRWGKIPVDVDPMTEEMLRRVCYLEVTIQRPRPDWIEDFGKIDPKLLSELFEEVSRHERRFRDHSIHRGESFGVDSLDKGTGAARVGTPVEPAI